MSRRPIAAEVRGTAKPARSFAGATDPDIVTLIVTLSATSTLASPLECAHTKNASANPLECAFTKSLDLKSPGINTYKKGGGSPLLAFYKFLFANSVHLWLHLLSLRRRLVNEVKSNTAAAEDRLGAKDLRVLLLWILAGLAGAGIAYKYFFRAFPEASLDLRVSRTQALEVARNFFSARGQKLDCYQSSIVFSVDAFAVTRNSR